MIILEDDNNEIKEEPESPATLTTTTTTAQPDDPQPETPPVLPPPYTESETGGRPEGQQGYGTFENIPKERWRRPRRMVKSVLMSWGLWALTFCLIQSSVALYSFLDREFVRVTLI